MLHYLSFTNEGCCIQLDNFEDQGSRCTYYVHWPIGKKKKRKRWFWKYLWKVFIGSAVRYTSGSNKTTNTKCTEVTKVGIKLSGEHGPEARMKCSCSIEISSYVENWHWKVIHSAFNMFNTAFLALHGKIISNRTGTPRRMQNTWGQRWPCVNTKHINFKLMV